MENNILDIKAGEGINLGVNGKEITISKANTRENLKMFLKENPPIPKLITGENSIKLFIDYNNKNNSILRNSSNYIPNTKNLIENNILNIKAGNEIILSASNKEINISSVGSNDNIVNFLKEKTPVMNLIPDNNSIECYIDLANYVNLENIFKDLDPTFEDPATLERYNSYYSSDSVQFFSNDNKKGIKLQATKTDKVTPAEWTAIYEMPKKLIQNHKYCFQILNFDIAGGTANSNAYILIELNNNTVYINNALRQPTTWGNYYLLTRIFTVKENADKATIKFTTKPSEAGYTKSPSIFMSGISMVDLTEAYGEGNEPDLETCSNWAFIETNSTIKI